MAFENSDNHDPRIVGGTNAAGGGTTTTHNNLYRVPSRPQEASSVVASPVKGDPGQKDWGQQQQRAPSWWWSSSKKGPRSCWNGRRRSATTGSSDNCDGDGTKTGKRCCLRFLKENRLVLLTLVGVFLGFLIGMAVRKAQPTKDAIMWIGLPGEVFLRCLTSMILPLIVSNVIAGSSSLDVKSNGRLGLTAIIYVIVTNLIGAIIGILLSLAIRPGSGITDTEPVSIETEKVMKTSDLFADLVRNMFPDNMVASTFRQTQTRYHSISKDNSTQLERYLINQEGTNILGIITLGFVFGMAASSIKDKGQPFRSFFESTSAVVTKILHYIFLITPIGVCSLIASSLAQIHSMVSIFESLGKLAATVSAGIVLHMFILIPVSYFIFFRKNPLRFLATCIRPCIIGFTFTSGSAALPEMEHCLVHKNHVDQRVGRAILPLIVTLNADGSSLFIVSAAMFVAQHSAITLNIGNIVALAFLTAISTMAIPGVPSSSIVALVLLLTSMNIPTHSVAMLYTIEWLLDRLRTSCNVLSHIFGSMFVFHFCKSHLPSTGSTPDQYPHPYHRRSSKERRAGVDEEDDPDEMSELTGTTLVTNSITTPGSDADEQDPKRQYYHASHTNGLFLSTAENKV